MSLLCMHFTRKYPDSGIHILFQDMIFTFTFFWCIHYLVDILEVLGVIQNTQTFAIRQLKCGISEISNIPYSLIRHTITRKTDFMTTLQCTYETLQVVYDKHFSFNVDLIPVRMRIQFILTLVFY